MIWNLNHLQIQFRILFLTEILIRILFLTAMSINYRIQFLTDILILVRYPGWSIDSNSVSYSLSDTCSNYVSDCQILILNYFSIQFGFFFTLSDSFFNWFNFWFELTGYSFSDRDSETDLVPNLVYDWASDLKSELIF